MGGVKKEIRQNSQSKRGSIALKLKLEIEKFGDQWVVQSECRENKESSTRKWCIDEIK